MKFCTLLFAVATAALVGSSAHAAVLASYEFSGADAAARAAATTTAANLTAGSLSFSANLADDVTASRAGFSAVTNMFTRVNATTSSTLATAITAAEYVSITIDANPGYQMNLTSLTVDIGYTCDGVAVPGGIGKSLGASVFSSVGGFTNGNEIATQTFTTVDLGPTGYSYQNVNIDLSGAAYQGLTEPLTFRIYFYDNYNDTQPIHRIDNFILNGAVAAIPEPGAAFLSSLGLLALLRRRR